LFLLTDRTGFGEIRRDIIREVIEDKEIFHALVIIFGVSKPLTKASATILVSPFGVLPKDLGGERGPLTLDWQKRVPSVFTIRNGNTDEDCAMALNKLKDTFV
jgi:hypothetical protein